MAKTDKRGTPKLIHLNDKVIESLTIQAVKNGTTFKEYAQQVLTKKSGVK